ncbi:MAG: DUF222 domain-containing protein [Acidimicrobiales bacterium]
MAIGGVSSSGFGVPDLAGVEELLALFLGPDGPDLSDGEQIDSVAALARLHGQVDAALTAAVDGFDGRVLCGVDGMRSTQAWLRSRNELSGTHVSALVQRARVLRDLPVLRAAFADGILGTAKVKMLLIARAGVEAVFDTHIGELIDLIADLTVAHAQVAVDTWRTWRRIAEASMAAPSDDDGPVPDPEDTNTLYLSSTLEGRFKLDGDLDAVSGQATANAVAAVIDEWFRTGACTADDGETPAHRRARALVELIARGAQPGEKQGRARPSVTINVDWGDYLGLAVEDPADVLGRRCGLTNGIPIGRRTAERLMCEADITALLTRTGLDGIIEPLGVAHTKRYPTPNERRALARRDQGCVFPGCDANVEWTDAHHLDHWHLHQRTELARLVLLCRYHHHCVHEGGYHLQRDPDGHIDVTRPDRTRLPRAGPGHQVTEPDEPDNTTATGPPGRRLAAPTRPHTRFRTLTQRRNAAHREQEWWRQQIIPRLADIVVGSEAAEY